MTRDEKPVVGTDDAGRSRSPSPHSQNEDRDRSSPRPFHSHIPSSSPRNLSIDVELSRKRKDRDDDLPSPGTPQSLASSFLMTPQFGPSEPSHKRRLSIIEHLALSEKEQQDTKPFAKKEEQSLPWYKGASGGFYDLANLAVPPQSPITVFPVQYNWNPAAVAQPNQATNGATSQGNTTPVSAQANNNSIPLDPTLSSMRSSAGAAGNGSNATDLANAIAPELRFTDETLASATASPARDGAESLVAAAAAAAQNAEAGSSSDLLAPPDDSSIKKEQPFSRSPELRVSHKLAERKRRKEMKELFDELRDELPSDRGMKASKWEILSKAIDHIRQIKTTHDQMVREIDHLRRDVDIARGGTGAYAHNYPSYNLGGSYTAFNSNTNTPTQSQLPQVSQQPQQPQGQAQAQPQQQQPVQQQQTQDQSQPQVAQAVQAQTQVQPAQTDANVAAA